MGNSVSTHISVEEFKDQVFSQCLFFIAKYANHEVLFKPVEECTADNLPEPFGQDFDAILNYYQNNRRHADQLIEDYIKAHIINSQENTTRFHKLLMAKLSQDSSRVLEAGPTAAEAVDVQSVATNVQQVYEAYAEKALENPATLVDLPRPDEVASQATHRTTTTNKTARTQASLATQKTSVTHKTSATQRTTATHKTSATQRTTATPTTAPGYSKIASTPLANAAPVASVIDVSVPAEVVVTPELSIVEHPRQEQTETENAATTAAVVASSASEDLANERRSLIETHLETTQSPPAHATKDRARLHMRSRSPSCERPEKCLLSHTGESLIG